VTHIQRAYAAPKAVWSWLRQRTGLLLMLLGSLVVLGAVGAHWHAARVPITPAGQAVTVGGPGLAQVVGVLRGGDDLGQRGTCQVGDRTVRVGYRQGYRSIEAGRLIFVGSDTTIVCNGIFAVASGPRSPFIRWPLSGVAGPWRRGRALRARIPPGP
jgi:hypothetical protein